MRKHFIDNLRWMIILMLIPYHAAQAFNVWGEPNYITFTPDKSISSLIVFLSPFYMPIMFVLAGMSTKYALRKRSRGEFLKERVKRLLIPLIFGTLVLCPILSYIGDKYNYGYDDSFFEHYKVFFTKLTDLIGADGGFNIGQFWFLLYLFVISLVSVGIIVLVEHFRKGTKEYSMPFWGLCLLGIPIPLLYQVLSVGGKSFAEFLYLFLFGYFVFSNDKVINTLVRFRFLTLALGVVAGIVDVYMFIWSGKDFGVANTIAKAISEWFWILAWIGIGQRRLEFGGKVSAYLSKRAFLFFSLHFVWTVLFQYWFSGILETNVALLYIVPILCAYVATFACTEMCYRIPVLRFLMGAK